MIPLSRCCLSRKLKHIKNTLSLRNKQHRIFVEVVKYVILSVAERNHMVIYFAQ